MTHTDGAPEGPALPDRPLPRLDRPGPGGERARPANENDREFLLSVLERIARDRGESPDTDPLRWGLDLVLRDATRGLYVIASAPVDEPVVAVSALVSRLDPWRGWTGRLALFEPIGEASDPRIATWFFEQTIEWGRHHGLNRIRIDARVLPETLWQSLLRNGLTRETRDEVVLTLRAHFDDSSL